ncbi:hypothetical protein PIB30_097369, partial [Stylosanthes scabra]|nr:hypothetical protein [Stylosanthes scabra]
IRGSEDLMRGYLLKLRKPILHLCDNPQSDPSLVRSDNFANRIKFAIFGSDADIYHGSADLIRFRCSSTDSFPSLDTMEKMNISNWCENCLHNCANTSSIHILAILPFYGMWPPLCG